MDPNLPGYIWIGGAAVILAALAFLTGYRKDFLPKPVVAVLVILAAMWPIAAAVILVVMPFGLINQIGKSLRRQSEEPK